MKKAVRNMLIILAALAFLATVTVVINPEMRSPRAIRTYILNRTPLGMSMDEVIRVIESKKRWGEPVINYQTGYVSRGPLVPGFPVLRGRSVIGEKSINLILGEYTIILETSVEVLWGFDENSKLIEVEVYKDRDVL